MSGMSAGGLSQYNVESSNAMGRVTLNNEL